MNYALDAGPIMALLNNEPDADKTEDAIVQDLVNMDIIVRDDHDMAFWKDAATFKGRHALSLPDGFCLALARRIGGTAVTTDHAEFDSLMSHGYCPIFFVR